MNAGRRKGLTLVELLAVISIVTGTIAIVVVGLVHAREAARRRHCVANLRALGMALQSYHQSEGMLPPAAIRAAASTALQLQNGFSEWLVQPGRHR